MHEQLSVNEITSAVFDPASQMVKCDPRQGKAYKHHIEDSNRLDSFQGNTWLVVFYFEVM